LAALALVAAQRPQSTSAPIHFAYALAAMNSLCPVALSA
jgi:hypothetical protein